MESHFGDYPGGIIMRQKCLLLTGCIVLASAISASAHFDILIGDKPWVKRGETATFKYYTGHPFEAELGNRKPPASVQAVQADGRRVDLKAKIEEKSVEYDGKKYPQYVFTYSPKRSGDVIIAIEGTREYGDSSCVDAFCKLILHCRRSEGWDQELGQALEIIPHTRPYGLRAGSIFSGMVKQGLSMPWNTPNGVALWTLDEEMIRLMKQSGCYEITLAIESGSRDSFDAFVKKPFTFDKVREVARLLKKYGIATFIQIIAHIVM